MRPSSEFNFKIKLCEQECNLKSQEMFLINLFSFSGTSVIQVTASDADDPTYGNSAKLVYSILEGQPYFSVEAQTGTVECQSL